MIRRRTLYFGFVHNYGHGLVGASGQVRRGIEMTPGFPWELAELDTRLLHQGQHPDVPDGKVFWLCAGRALDPWHAFLWWDRSGDHRPAANSGLYVHGFEAGQEVQAFAYGCRILPGYVDRFVRYHGVQLELQR